MNSIFSPFFCYLKKMLICIVFALQNFYQATLKISEKYRVFERRCFFLPFLLFYISLCHFERWKKKQSRQTVVIVPRKQVPNNHATVSDFLGCEDSREKEHCVNRRERREREPKGLVTKVTVPTASSRKAKCAASQLAHFLPYSSIQCGLKIKHFFSIKSILRNLEEFWSCHGDNLIGFHVSSTQHALFLYTK